MIDHHLHLGEDQKFNFNLTGNEALEKMSLHGIEKAIVFACPNQEMSKKNPYSNSNKFILNSAKKTNKLSPFMFVHPLKDTMEYFSENEKNFEGFKLLPKVLGGEYSYEKLKNNQIMEYLANSSKPTVFHTGYREGQRIKDLIWFTQIKKGPISFAHSGRLIHEDLEEASKYDNVFIDVSPLATMIEKDSFIDKKRCSKKLDNITPNKVLDYLESLFRKERIVWGSDSPWSDHLIKEGYKKETNIAKLMEVRGLTYSFIQ